MGRSQRLKLWENRSGLERDVADIARQEVVANNQSLMAAATRKTALQVESTRRHNQRGIPATKLLHSEIARRAEPRASSLQEVPTVVYGSAEKDHAFPSS